jgi:hypothetical protein
MSEIKNKKPMKKSSAFYFGHLISVAFLLHLHLDFSRHPCEGREPALDLIEHR